MKQIEEQINKQTDMNAHTEASEMLAGERGLSTLLKKFKDVESLCRAYNSLESEFTKRCQRIKELERENEKLQTLLIKNDDAALPNDRKIDEKENEGGNDSAPETFEKENVGKNDETLKTVDNGLIGGLIDEKNRIIPPKGLAKEVFNDSVSSEVFEGERLGVILDFFKDYPDAVKYAKEIGYVACGKDFSKEDLQKAYITILQNRGTGFTKKDFQGISYENLPADLKERIIKEYLTTLNSQTVKPVLMGGKGVIPLTPPYKPQSIAEAGALAKNLIKLR